MEAFGDGQVVLAAEGGGAEAGEGGADQAAGGVGQVQLAALDFQGGAGLLVLA